LDELSYKLESFSYRILKKDCLDLPDKLYIKRSVELTDEQAVAYKQMKDNAVTLLEKDGGMVTAQNVLTQMLRLQQICSGFIKTDDGQIEKLSTNKLTELLTVLEEVTGKVIIWAVYVEDLRMIQEALAKQYGAESVAVYAGKTHPEERQVIVLEFQNPDSKLRFFVGQSRTGGYGLTLTEASTVIYYANSFDLEVRIQSEDRAHRIGQKNNVTYIDLVTENTVEEKVLKALRNKINIASEVLSEGYKEWLI
jgi:SNF2 family DNA or RNA helicase